MLLVKLICISSRFRRAFCFWIISLSCWILIVSHLLHLGQDYFNCVVGIFKIYLFLSHLFCNKRCILLSTIIAVISRMLGLRLITILLILLCLTLLLRHKILYLTCFFRWCCNERVCLSLCYILRLFSFVLGGDTQVNTLLFRIDFVVLNYCSDYLSNIVFIYHPF